MMGEVFRILLVEDNEADVYLFRKALQSVGLEFELIVMEDGGKAIEFVRGEGEHAGRGIPDLAVIDLSLPKNDGVQVLEAIRADECFAGMPVVVTSSSATPPARLDEKHLQVARYITKPPDLEEFLKIGAALKETLQQGHAQRASRRGMANASTRQEKTPKTFRIFLVEDNAGDVYLLEKTLQNRGIGYELIRYDDGERAINALRADDFIVPDLIIVDLNLPRREGFEVLQTVRGKPGFVGVPRAILTSSDAVKDKHRVAVTGGERYIHKPPMLEDFLDQVGQSIEDLLAAGR